MGVALRASLVKRCAMVDVFAANKVRSPSQEIFDGIRVVTPHYSPSLWARWFLLVAWSGALLSELL
ncbi:hypothetical protein, partial [Rhodopirellula europaea]|uniref:hypothetical protein n=1 Tax=Rhodopirellula europaea TaxID=1263866 RepID=UPI0030EEC21C